MPPARKTKLGKPQKPLPQNTANLIGMDATFTAVADRGKKSRAATAKSNNPSQNSQNQLNLDGLSDQSLSEISDSDEETQMANRSGKALNTHNTLGSPKLIRPPEGPGSKNKSSRSADNSDAALLENYTLLANGVKATHDNMQVIKKEDNTPSLHWRSKLRRCFFSKEEKPTKKDWEVISNYFEMLNDDLEDGEIPDSNVYKDLNKILQLKYVPGGARLNFKHRIKSMVEKWDKAIDRKALSVDTVQKRTNENHTNLGGQRTQNSPDPIYISDTEEDESSEDITAQDVTLKNVLYLRYELQKYFLINGQKPKEGIELMSEYLHKLENLPDLEGNIIRTTKVCRVLVKILRLEEIPDEAKFQFKSRAQRLVERWNKALQRMEPSADGERRTSEGNEKDQLQAKGLDSQGKAGKVKAAQVSTPSASRHGRNKSISHTVPADYPTKQLDSTPATLKRRCPRNSEGLGDGGLASHRRKCLRTNTSNREYRIKEHSWLNMALLDYTGQIKGITSNIKCLEEILGDLKYRRDEMINFKGILVGWGAEEEEITKHLEGSEIESDES